MFFIRVGLWTMRQGVSHCVSVSPTEPIGQDWINFA